MLPTASLPTGHGYRPTGTGSWASPGSSNLTSVVVVVMAVSSGENGTGLESGQRGDNSSGFADDRRKGENCADQDAAFALAYTVVTAVQSVGSIGVGHAQRILGIRTARIGSG